jgi:NCS1 family nucleobase:cation symporter-1
MVVQEDDTFENPSGYVMDRLRLRERVSAAAQKVQSRLVQASSWKLPKQSSSIAPPNVWTNADMDPVPPERRTWGRGAFINYWFSDLVTISTWSSGSAVITLGKSN